MGMRRGKPRRSKSELEGIVSSHAADMRALEAIRAKRLTGAGGDMFEGFGTLGDPPVHGAPKRHSVSGHTHAVDMAEIIKKLEIDPMMKVDWMADATSPVKTKRNWGELLRNVPDGIYRLAQSVNGGLTFAGSRHDLNAESETYTVSDATGEQEVEVYTFALGDNELRKDDAAVGKIVDRQIRATLILEAVEMLGDDVPDTESEETILRLLFNEHALYPAIHLSKKGVQPPSGDGQAVAFAIQWVYEPSMDEDDEDDVHEEFLSEASLECGKPTDGWRVMSVYGDAPKCPRCPGRMDGAAPDMDASRCSTCGHTESGTAHTIRTRGGLYGEGERA